MPIRLAMDGDAGGDCGKRKLWSLVGATVSAVLIATLLVIFPVSPDPASATPSFVQARTTTTTSSMNMNLAFSSNNTAGNLIVVAVTWDSATNSTFSCSDSRGNTYASPIIQNDPGNNQAIGVCWAANIAAGANTVTATWPGNPSFRGMSISEYSGVSTTDAFDVSAKNDSTGNTAANNITSTSAITTVDGALIYGATMNTDAGVNTVTAGTGFTKRSSVGPITSGDMNTQDMVQTTAGSVASTMTYSANNQDYVAIMVAFKPAGPPPPPPPPEPTEMGDGVLAYGVASNTTPQVRKYSNSDDTFSSATGGASGGTGVTHVTRTSPNKQEAIAGYVTSGGTLYISCFDGITWTNGWNVSVSGTGTTTRFDIAYETNSGDVMVLYSTNNTTNELAYRTKPGDSGCASSSWSSATTVNASNTSGRVHWVKMAWDRRETSDLITAIWADSNSDLSAMTWSGTAWGNEPSSALETSLEVISAAQDVDDFDVEYESLSGDVMVAWANSAGANDTNGVRYATCTGGVANCAWSSVSTPPTFADDAHHLDISANPISDEIVFASIGSAGSDLQAGYWSGSAWTNTANLDTSTQAPVAGAKMVSTGWLTSGGTSRSVVVYNDSSATNIGWYVGNGSTFSAQSDQSISPAFGGAQRWYDLQPDPVNMDRLMFAAADSSSDLFAKRLVMTSGGAFTWTDSDGSVLEASLAQAAPGAFSFAHWRHLPVVIDDTVNTADATHDGTSPTSVFIDPNTGYVFYRDSNGRCVYSKTADGGETWGSAVDITTDSNCAHFAIWYDRWTPGEFTTSYIHIPITSTTTNDLHYNRLDPSTDTLLSGTSPVAISSAPGPAKTNTFAADANFPTISRSTAGILYVGISDSGTGGDQSYVLRCSTSCSTASNWSDTSITMTSDRYATLQLLPQRNGDMMAIFYDTAASDVLSKIFTGFTSSWAGSWTTVDSSASHNSAYAGNAFSAFVDPSLYTIYLAYVGDASTLGTNDDVRTARYGSGSWTTTTNAITNDTRGIATAQLTYDLRSGHIYVGYLALSTPTDATTAGIYWKKSTDDMSTWGDEGGAVNGVADDLSGFRFNGPSLHRIHASWVMATADMLMGETIALPVRAEFGQSAYRIFANANSATPGAALAAANTPVTTSNASDAFRLRLLVHGYGFARYDTAEFKLQFAGLGGGTCAAPSGTPAVYTDVTTSTAISFYDNSNPSNGNSTSPVVGDPTHGADPVMTQTYVESNSFRNFATEFSNGYDGLWDISLYGNGAVSGTTYCLRVVESDGIVLSDYTQYPTVTTEPSNQAPNSPSSLQQRDNGNSVIATGEWTNTTTVKFSATASDPDSSDTLYLCVERQLIATPFTNAETSCGSGVAYSGTPLSVTYDNSGHTNGTQYHWQARIKDSAGAYSSWVSFDVNDESDSDFGIDTTAPGAFTVYDGTSVGSDSNYNDGSLSSLSANWSASSGGASGLDRYEYKIGTTPGDDSIKALTSTGTTASMTATGLSLRTTQIYYVTVIAYDGAGNSTTVTSNGQYVAPTLIFAVDDTSIEFEHLSSSNGYTDSKSFILTTNTNGYGGYTIRAYKASGMTSSQGDTINDYSSDASNPTTWTGTGFGYTVSGGSAINAFSGNKYAGFGDFANPDVPVVHAGTVQGSPITNEQETVTMKVAVGAEQGAGTYQAVVVWNCVVGF